MSVATLQFEPNSFAGSLGGVHGAAEIGFIFKQGETRLNHLFQHDPLRVLFPTPAPGEPPCAVLVTTSGGIVGGDHLDVCVSAGPGTTAMAMVQAAEKIYRSAGENSRIDVHLSVGQDAWLEWLPQETILFDGSRMCRRTAIDLEPGARVLAGEILVFGRIASGERLTHGLVREAWELRRQNRLIWADALYLEDNMETIFTLPACFNGATAQATAVYAGDDAIKYLELARSMFDDGEDELRSAATVVNGVLVVRWLGRDPVRLRQAFGKFWERFRHAAANLPATLPRLWAI